MLPLEIEDEFEEARKEQKKHEAESKARCEFADMLIKIVQADFKEPLHYTLSVYAGNINEYLIHFKCTRRWLKSRWVKKHVMLQVIDYRRNKKSKKYSFVLAIFDPSLKPIAEKLAGHLVLVHQGEHMKLYVIKKPLTV